MARERCTDGVTPSSTTRPRVTRRSSRSRGSEHRPPAPIVAGYTALGLLAGVPRAKLAALHGMGPKALAIVEDALAPHGLRLGQ